MPQEFHWNIHYHLRKEHGGEFVVEYLKNQILPFHLIVEDSTFMIHFLKLLVLELVVKIRFENKQFGFVDATCILIIRGNARGPVLAPNSI